MEGKEENLVPIVSKKYVCPYMGIIYIYIYIYIYPKLESHT